VPIGRDQKSSGNETSQHLHVNEKKIIVILLHDVEDHVVIIVEGDYPAS